MPEGLLKLAAADEDEAPPPHPESKNIATVKTGSVLFRTQASNAKCYARCERLYAARLTPRGAPTVDS
jgi:hypothetical protein